MNHIPGLPNRYKSNSLAMFTLQIKGDLERQFVKAAGIDFGWSIQMSQEVEDIWSSISAGLEGMAKGNE